MDKAQWAFDRAKQKQINHNYISILIDIMKKFCLTIVVSDPTSGVGIQAKIN